MISKYEMIAVRSNRYWSEDLHLSQGQKVKFHWHKSSTYDIDAQSSRVYKRTIA